jgi:hypothetical protein
MKKINLPLAATLALFAALFFSSCKKDYTCACRVTVVPFFDTTVNVEMEDYKKKQAEKACENNNETIKLALGAMIAKALEGFQQDSFSTFPINPADLVSANCEIK